MADAANRSRGSGRRVRGAFVPDVRCGYRNPTLSSILATQIPCRSCRSGAQAARRELCGVALTAGCKNGHPHAVRHLFVAVIASIISYASRVSTDILTIIMPSSLRCCSRFSSAVFFLFILLHFIQAFPLTYLHSHLLSQGQYRIILSADTACEVPQPSERCLSR